jgi:N-acetylglucosamine-6-phosphate deacetylase
VTTDSFEVEGRLVLDDRVAPGRIAVEDGRIAAVEVDAGGAESPSGVADDRPSIAPGFVDLHVHGFGGFDAMGGPDALSGMARALRKRGVTSFLPTAVTASLDALERFADDVRAWIPTAPEDGAQPLGFNLEGPFLSEARRGAHDASLLLAPADVPASRLDRLADGLRLITIAPELPGAHDLIAWAIDRGVVVSLGHSAATFAEATAGYAAGARSTTHLFNAMTGIDHRSPGLALAALLDDRVAVELIADGNHVVPEVWPLITRLKPPERLFLVSDAISLAGTDTTHGRIGGLDVEVIEDRVVLAGTSTLAGSVIALDTAVQNMVASGVPLPYAVGAASRNPLGLLGITDRGRIDVGQRADVVELDERLRVRP